MKSMLKYEKRNLIALTILYTIGGLILLKCILVNSLQSNIFEIFNLHLQDYRIGSNFFVENFMYGFSILLLLIGIPISFISVLQYREEKVYKAGEFIATLPVKKKHRFFLRTCLGMLVYTIPWLVLTIATLILRVKCDGWYQEHVVASEYGSLILGSDSVESILLVLFYIWIVLTLIYAIGVFVQNICKRPWLAGAISYGITLFPMIIIGDFITRMYEVPSEKLWWSNILLNGVPTEDIYYYDEGALQDICIVQPRHIGLIMSAQILLIVIFLGCSYYVYTKYDISRKNQLFYYPWMQKLFVFGVVLSIVSFLAVDSLMLHESMEPNYMLAGVILVSFICSKIILRKLEGRQKGGVAYEGNQ